MPRKLLPLLASTEIIAAALLALGGFISARLLPWAVGILACYWPLRWLAYRRLSVRTAADWPIGGLVVMAMVSLGVTAFPENTWPQVMRLLLGIELYYAIVNWGVNGGRMRRLANVGLFAGLGLALYALVSVDWAINKRLFVPGWVYQWLPPLVPDTANPNVMAGSLVILLPVSLALIWSGWRSLRGWERLLALVSALAGTLVLVLTQSRGGLLAFGVMILALVMLRWRWGWLLPAAAVPVIVGLMAWLGVQPALNLILESTTLGGVDGRMEVWSRAVYMIRDFPFTGVGLGNYGSVADLMYPFFLYRAGTVPHAHNLLLQIGVDLGLPGLIFWLATWMLTTLMAWQVYQQGRRAQHGWVMGLGMALLCSQLALIAHGQLDAVTWGMVRPAPLVWVLWGMAAAGAQVYARRTRPAG